MQVQAQRVANNGRRLLQDDATPSPAIAGANLTSLPSFTTIESANGTRSFEEGGTIEIKFNNNVNTFLPTDLVAPLKRVNSTGGVERANPGGVVDPMLFATNSRLAMEAFKRAQKRAEMNNAALAAAAALKANATLPSPSARPANGTVSPASKPSPKVSPARHSLLCFHLHP